VIGHRFIEFLDEEDIARAVSSFQEGLVTKKDYTLEFRYKKKTVQSLTQKFMYNIMRSRDLSDCYGILPIEKRRKRSCMTL
jgi:hypothetical protein